VLVSAYLLLLTAHLLLLTSGALGGDGGDNNSPPPPSLPPGWTWQQLALAATGLLLTLPVGKTLYKCLPCCSEQQDRHHQVFKFSSNSDL
jgi:hypothetical protein